MLKITYATMSADNEELQSAFDGAIARVRAGWLGREVPMFIGGEKVFAGEKDPLIFGEPQEWLALLVEALKALAQGRAADAASLRARAKSSARA